MREPDGNPLLIPQGLQTVSCTRLLQRCLPETLHVSCLAYMASGTVVRE